MASDTIQTDAVAADALRGLLGNVAIGGDALAVGLVVVGLAMWIVGRRLIRPFFALLFAGIGGSCGFVGAAAMDIDISPTIALAVGLAVGAVFGFAFFRFSMALAMAIALGAAAPLLAGAALSLSAPGVSAPELLTQEELFLDLESRPATEAGATEAPPAYRERARAAVRAASDEIAALWADLPTSDRLLITIAAGLGTLAGFLVGLAYPKLVAVFATAIVGPAVWVPAAVWLLGMHAPAFAERLPRSALVWALAWTALSGVGLAAQWTVFRPRADSAKR